MGHDLPARLRPPSAAPWPSGELRIAAEFTAGGPARIEWLGDVHVVALAPQRRESPEEIDDDERKRRPKIIASPLYRFNGRGYFHDRPAQVWVVDLGADGQEPGDAPTPIGAVGVDHGSFAVSPDGSTVVAIAPIEDNDRVVGGSRVVRYDLSRTDDGTVTASDPTMLTTAPGGWAELLWHPTDGLFVVGSDDLSTIEFNRLHRVDPSAPGEPVEAAFDDVNITVGPSTGAVVDGGVVAVGPRRGRVGIDRYSTSDGGRTVVYEDDSTVVAFAADPTGTTVVAQSPRPSDPPSCGGSTMARPPDWSPSTRSCCRSSTWSNRRPWR